MKGISTLLLAVVLFCLAGELVSAAVSLNSPADGFYYWVSEGAWFAGRAVQSGSGSAYPKVRIGFMNQETPAGWISNRLVSTDASGDFATSVTVPSYCGDCDAAAQGVFSDGTGSDEWDKNSDRIEDGSC